MKKTKFFAWMKDSVLFLCKFIHSVPSSSYLFEIRIANDSDLNRRVLLLYPEVGPWLRHLQLPVVLPPGEALKAEHLPGVIEARLVGGDGPWPGGQVLRPAVLLGQEQVAVGRAWVKREGAAVCEHTGRTENGDVFC